YLDSRGDGDEEKLAAIQDENTPFWHGAQDISGYRYVDCHCSPGDVLIFHRYMLHASLPNNSDRIRLSLDMRYFGAEGRTSKHYLDVQQAIVYEPFTGKQ